MNSRLYWATWILSLGACLYFLGQAEWVYRGAIRTLAVEADRRSSYDRAYDFVRKERLPELVTQAFTNWQANDMCQQLLRTNPAPGSYEAKRKELLCKYPGRPPSAEEVEAKSRPFLMQAALIRVGLKDEPLTSDTISFSRANVRERRNRQYHWALAGLASWFGLGVGGWLIIRAFRQNRNFGVRLVRGVMFSIGLALLLISCLYAFRTWSENAEDLERLRLVIAGRVSAKNVYQLVAARVNTTRAFLLCGIGAVVGVSLSILSATRHLWRSTLGDGKNPSGWSDTDDT